MAYKISYHHRLGWRWWDTGGPYCDVSEEHHARPATEAEILLIRRIINAAQGARAAPASTTKLRVLMSGQARAAGLPEAPEPAGA